MGSKVQRSIFRRCFRRRLLWNLPLNIPAVRSVSLKLQILIRWIIWSIHNNTGKSSLKCNSCCSHSLLPFTKGSVFHRFLKRHADDLMLTIAQPTAIRFVMVLCCTLAIADIHRDLVAVNIACKQPGIQEFHG